VREPLGLCSLVGRGAPQVASRDSAQMRIFPQTYYYWDTDIHSRETRATSVLLFSVSQLHYRKGCKPQTRSNYLVNKCYSYRSHPRHAIDQSVPAQGPKIIVKNGKPSGEVHEGRMAWALSLHSDIDTGWRAWIRTVDGRIWYAQRGPM